jgi:flagellar hook-basal body complex protein FliE
VTDKIGNINRILPGLVEKPVSLKENQEAQKPDKTSFAKELSNLVNSVNDLQSQAGEAQKAFLNGEPVELHDVMIKAEEAGLAMDLLLQIRNRLLDGYKELIRMPV